MDAEIKRKWVEALRSGEFKQGAGFLKSSNNRYCCLGVLCVVKGDDLDAIKKKHGTLNLCTAPAELSCVMPHNSKLAEMNDAGFSFAEIADYIEANL